MELHILKSKVLAMFEFHNLDW